MQARPPVHAPAWQEPMLQTVPFALGGGASHIPVAWSQTPRRVSHSLRGGQVTRTHISVCGVLFRRRCGSCSARQHV